MLFNSLEYLIFFPIVLILNWTIFKNHLKIQNLFILIISYIFYGWWDWRFLFLIFLSTTVDYFTGSRIYSSERISLKKYYLCLSILFNLGLLGFFKYCNFFIESWIDLLASIGYQKDNYWTANFILPVGISFYTFQTMSYSLDIYYKKLKPTKDFISFASFVSFFPQLIAGPIERASNLLPQILNPRVFKYGQAVKGARLILWGMFKKVVIADSLASRANYCFDRYEVLDGGTLLLGLIYFSFQIYCDFSGYSDIAIGTAKLFGFELMPNFKYPYFSRNIIEFWKKWHISLSSWFRDYLYIPLGGSRGGKYKTISNVFIIFVLSGFWHGAKWNFIIWGFVHFLFYIPYLLLNKNRISINSNSSIKIFYSSIKDLVQIGYTFFTVMIAWVFFRSDSITASFNYLANMISKLSVPQDNRFGIIFVLILLVLEWSFKDNVNGVLAYNNYFIRRLIYLVLFYLIFAFFPFFESNQFIYFQF